MTSSARPKRFHDLLLTIEEVKEGTPFYSDHLPIMTEIPMEKDTIKMVTWNVHAPSEDGSESGLDAKETDEQVIERGKNSIAAIMRMIDKQDPLDMVLLQESYFFDPVLAAKMGPVLGSLLKQELDKRGWDFKEHGGPKDKPDLMTLINKKRLTLTDQAIYPEIKGQEKLSKQSQEDLKFRTQQMKFTINNSNQNIEINNVHWMHGKDPVIANELLTLMHQQPCITAGDFNHRIVQPGKEFLPTNVVSPKFRNNKQGVDHTDGFFFAGPDGKIHHPKNTYILNPNSGQKFVSPVKVSLDDFTEEQKLELQTYRPFVTVAEEHARELGKMIGDLSIEFLVRNNIFLRLNQVANPFSQIKSTSVSFLIDNKNPQNVEILNRIKLELADHVECSEKELTLPVKKLKQAINIIKNYYLEIQEQNRRVLALAVEPIKKTLNKLNAEIKASKKADVIAAKTALRNDVETLGRIVEDWQKKGSAEESKSFARQLRLLAVTKPVEPGLFGAISKKITGQNINDLLSPLAELDKQLIFVPFAKLVDTLGKPEDREEVEEKRNDPSLTHISQLRV